MLFGCEAPTGDLPAPVRPVCLVTGATGALGPVVVSTLRAAYGVRTLARRPAPAALFDADVTTFTGDVSNPEQLRAAARGADVIVHLAALLHITDPAPALRREYQRINVGGTAAVLDAAKALGVRRVVLVSTIAVYGAAGGVTLDETSTPRPNTFYGETKLAAERLALDARLPDNRPFATVLRPAAVYGARVKGNYQRLVQALARGRFVPVGPGDNRRTLVHEDDLASAIALATAHPAAPGHVYNVTDGTTHAMQEIIGAICAGLGRRPPQWRAPVAPVRAALGIAGILNKRFPRALDTYLEDVAVSGERIRRELGFEPCVGLIDGWARTIAEMRRARVL